VWGTIKKAKHGVWGRGVSISRAPPEAPVGHLRRFSWDPIRGHRCWKLHGLSHEQCAITRAVITVPFYYESHCFSARNCYIRSETHR